MTFISSYEKYREALIAGVAIESLLHTGPALFDVGNPGTLQTAAYTLRNEADIRRRENAEGTYLRLVKEPDANAKRVRFEQALARLRQGEADPIVYHYRQADFAAIPGSPWVYNLPKCFNQIFSNQRSLGAFAPAKEGINTGDNEQFIRLWWEVLSHDRNSVCLWRRLAKGEKTLRFVNPSRYVVCSDISRMERLPGSAIRNRDCFFRPGITFLSNSSSRFCAWITGPDHVFCSTGGRSLFPPQDMMLLLLALLNSTLIDPMLTYINPTITIKVGDLNALPLPSDFGIALSDLAERAITLATQKSREDETTWDFIAPPAWPDGVQQVAARHAQLAEIERQIDEEVYRLYGISDDDRKAIEDELMVDSSLIASGDSSDDEATTEEPITTNQESITIGHLADQWLNYAIGIVLGQFQPGNPDGLGRGTFDTTDTTIGEQLRVIRDQDGLTPADPDHPQHMAGHVWAVLDIMQGDTAAAAIVREALGPGSPHNLLSDFLADKYFKNHIQQYRKRPIYWLLQSSKKNYALWLYYHHLDKDLLFKALVNYVEPKIRLETSRLETLHSQKTTTGDSGKEAKRLAKDAERQEDFLSELRDFEDKLRRAANLHLEPDLNDGKKPGNTGTNSLKANTSGPRSASSCVKGDW